MDGTLLHFLGPNIAGAGDIRIPFLSLREQDCRRPQLASTAIGTHFAHTGDRLSNEILPGLFRFDTGF